MEFLLDTHPAIFIAFGVVGTVLFLPGSVTMTLAGFLFGLWPGLLYAGIVIPLGAQCAFLFGRWFARPWIDRRLASRPRMRAIDAGLREEGFIIVLLSRLSLVIPFNAFNYICGASPIRSTTYATATIVGMVPAIVLYVYLGTVASDIRAVMSGESTPSELSWWLLGVGVVVLAGLVTIIRRVAKRALQKHLQVEEKQSFAA